VERVEERQRALSRQAPGREFEQVIVANPDQAVFVFACADPEPSLRMLDRFLVVAEREQIPARICANKVDLIGIQDARDLFGIYEEIGYDVIYTSALTGEGLAALKEMFSGRISVLAGPSGVGKSSLLNALQPGLGQRTKAISLGTRKGQHTTVAPELIPLEGGGYVADTPGLKAFALWDIEAEEVDAYFREIGPLVADCTFSNCSHTHEPGCAVKEALARGDLALQRYESYLRLRKGDLD
jgi:ribosome biogenesis GTPase